MQNSHGALILKVSGRFAIARSARLQFSAVDEGKSNMDQGNIAPAQCAFPRNAH